MKLIREQSGIAPLKDGTFMPYPHYAFPRALPIELKGIGT